MLFCRMLLSVQYEVLLTLLFLWPYLPCLIAFVTLCTNICYNRLSFVFGNRYNAHLPDAIDALMNEDTGRDSDSGLSAPVTERIADRNERTLKSFGIEKLRKMFNSDVLQCPMRSKHEDYMEEV